MKQQKIKVQPEYLEKLNSTLQTIYQLVKRHQCSVNDIDVAIAFPNRLPALTADVMETWGPFGLLDASQAMSAMLNLEHIGHDCSVTFPEFSASGKGRWLRLNIEIYEYARSVVTFEPVFHKYIDDEHDVEGPQWGFEYQQNEYDGEWYSTIGKDSMAEITSNVAAGKRLGQEPLHCFTNKSSDFLDSLFEQDAIRPDVLLCEIAIKHLLGFNNPKVAGVMVYHLLKWGAIEDRFEHFAECELGMDKEQMKLLESVLQQAKTRILHDDLGAKLVPKLKVRESKLKL